MTPEPQQEGPRVRDYPKIVVPPPGPKAQAIVHRDEAWTAPCYIKEYPLVVSHGRGPMVEDVDGNRFLDFMAGAARVAPGPSRKRVFLTNSGTEATEGAIKLVRYATRRTAIIAFRGAFHGRSTGAVTLTSSKARQHAGFGPLLPDVYHVPYAYRYRCQFCADQDECNRGCIAAIEQELFTRQLDPSDVAAIFVEPIQGEGGYIVPPQGYLPVLRRCTRNPGPG